MDFKMKEREYVCFLRHIGHRLFQKEKKCTYFVKVEFMAELLYWIT